MDIDDAFGAQEDDDVLVNSDEEMGPPEPILPVEEPVKVDPGLGGEGKPKKKVRYSDVARILAKKDQSSEKFKLSVSEFHIMAARLAKSVKDLRSAYAAIDRSESAASIRAQINGSHTFRASVLHLHDQTQAKAQPGIEVSVYRIELVDQSPKRKAYLFLKYKRNCNIELQEGTCYVIDNVSATVNGKGQVVFMTTHESTLSPYRRDDDQDSIDLVSDEEISDKEEGPLPPSKDFMRQEAERYQREAEEENNRSLAQHRGLHDEGPRGDWAGQPRAQIQSVFSIVGLLPNGKPNLSAISILSSTKQIVASANSVLKQLSVLEDNPVRCRELSQLWSFKELLSWKIPVELSSTEQNFTRNRLEATYLPPPIHLYRYNLVTQRIKEQLTCFCGIVTHVRQGNWKDNKMQEDNGDGKLVNSQIDMESIDDKSRVCLFIKHDQSVNLKEHILPQHVLLVRGALRKISNNLDIYVQMQLFENNLKVIGRVEEDVNDFESNNRIQMLQTIPSDQIIRHVIKVCGFIVDLQFIKIQFKCEHCKTELQNENMCSNGCIVKSPKLILQVLCILQDGTTKASLELRNDKVIKAFNISEAEQRKFKDYCMQHGSFQNPSSNSNFMYKEIVNVFRRVDKFNQLIFYCKPYSKAQNQSKKDMGQAQFGASAMGGFNAYQETVSRPTFIAQDKQKEREVFLNGEVNVHIKKAGGQEKINKKTTTCLKALNIESGLGREALKNFYNLTQNAAKTDLEMQA